MNRAGMGLKLKKISAVAWDIDRGDVVFQIRLVDGVYAIDVFERTGAALADTTLASYAGYTWSCVTAYVVNFNPDTVFPEPGYGDEHGYGLE